VIRSKEKRKRGRDYNGNRRKGIKKKKALAAEKKVLAEHKKSLVAAKKAEKEA